MDVTGEDPGLEGELGGAEGRMGPVAARALTSKAVPERTRRLPVAKRADKVEARRMAQDV